jgi:phosphotransferase system HPr (HPr) family protein
MPLSQDAMNREILRRKVTVKDPLGFHLRPIAVFAQCARKYESTINVQKDDVRVDGKSPMELLMLAAAQGTELVLEADGADAPAALEALAELIEISKDDEPGDPSLPPKG